ncbi:MAG: ribonuclease PH [Acidobacteria bacterium]|nr:ribonuclease PH [Acidobacteriota bacterium]
MNSFKRKSARLYNKIREVEIIPDFQSKPLASVLVKMGDTQVICACSEEAKVPPFINEPGSGWVTAEYSLLPSATETRTQREAAKGKQSGRTTEIQRIIGRCLRSVVDLSSIGERTLYIDCDTIQADGGTRTAAITGGFTALAVAIVRLMDLGKITAEKVPLKDYLAAVSVGLLQSGEMLLDLDYYEDSNAAVDLNVIRTANGKYVEIQGGAEKEPFSRQQLDEMLKLADAGIEELIVAQRKILDKYVKF